jgi:hypothetical protein
MDDTPDARSAEMQLAYGGLGENRVDVRAAAVTALDPGTRQIGGSCGGRAFYAKALRHPLE